jgi:glycosyltransferase involved in cell wall biosynthesis
MAVPRVAAVIEATTLTGPARNLLRFCRRSRATSDPELGADISVVTFHRGAAGGVSTPFLEAARADGIPTELIAERRRFDTDVTRRLTEILDRIQPDIVQTHSVKSHFLMRWTGLGKRYRWLAFHHGYTFDDLKMRAYNQLDRWSLPAAGKMVTVCGPFARQLERIGVDPQRIHVLPNSIEPSVSAGAEQIQALRERLGIRPGERVILGIGRFSAEKAPMDLVRAAAQLRRSHPEVSFRLVLVGDGPERERVTSAAAGEGLDAIFPGQQREVWPYYGLADVYALPSHSEGSPNVILEAMAAGVPIAATAVGGVPEMLRDQESALLVPARDPDALAAALGRLLTEPELAATLARNAAEDIERRFTPLAYQRSLVKLYRDYITAS